MPPIEPPYLIVWSTTGTPLWAGRLQVRSEADIITASRPTDACSHLNVAKLGGVVAAMGSLCGDTRVSCLSLACPTGSASTTTVPVDVLVVQGVLAMVAVVTTRTIEPMLRTSGNSNALDHPCTPLVVLALSLLEPECAAHDTPPAANMSGPSGADAVRNPFAGDPSKVTPTNSLCCEQRTPGAPTKIVPASDDGSHAGADDLAKQVPRWRTVTQALIRVAEADIAQRRRNEALSAPQIIEEAGGRPGDNLGSWAHTDRRRLLVDITATMEELVEWWCTQQHDLARRILLVRSVMDGGSRVDEAHPASPMRLHSRMLHPWLHKALPAVAAPPPLHRRGSNMVHPEGKDPICQSMPVDLRELSDGGNDAQCLAVMQLRDGAHLSVVLCVGQNALGFSSGSGASSTSGGADQPNVLETAMRQWNLMAELATTF